MYQQIQAKKKKLERVKLHLRSEKQDSMIFTIKEQLN